MYLEQPSMSVIFTGSYVHFKRARLTSCYFAEDVAPCEIIYNEMTLTSDNLKHSFANEIDRNSTSLNY